MIHLYKFIIWLYAESSELDKVDNFDEIVNMTYLISEFLTDYNDGGY